MYHKKVVYEDFNGNPQTEDLYFHLRKDELAKFTASEDGGVDKKLKEIIDPIGLKEGDSEEEALKKVRDTLSTADIVTIMDIYKALILAAYGKKSEDGQRFYKKDPETGKPLRDEFEQSAAFEVFFDEISQNADAASEFIEGTIPGINVAKDQAR